MAKRKKKSGGGAFGEVGKRMNDPGGPPPGLDLPAGGGDQPMKLLQKAILSQGLKSPEELVKFLNERAVGRPLDELAAELLLEGPETDVDRADALMDGLDDDASPAEIRRTAVRALKITPECTAAWLELSVLEEDPVKALDLCDQGIAKARVRFGDLIESVEEGQGIWGWIEARDFMRLLLERAYRLEEIGNLEEAAEVYQEMLSLNSPDNQGVRGDLLRLLLVFRRLEDAGKLLDLFPNDSTPDFGYGRALVAIVEAEDRTGFQMSAETPETPADMVKSLGSGFRDAIKTLKKAVEANPFVPLMMREPQIMGIDIPETVLFGGPFEAAIYTQRWGNIWYATGLPMVMLLSHYPRNVERLIKTKGQAAELAEIIEQADSLDDVPWWEKFDDDKS